MKSIPGVSHDDILRQVVQEKQNWMNFVDQKRDLFRERLKLYQNISDTDNKIYVKLIRSVIQTLLSLYYTDENTVIFAWRQLWDDEYADNLNNLAKFDYEEMNLAQINYDVQWNRLFYWVGIRIFDYWDEERKVPVFKSIDPLSWVPDPLGYIDNHRFHWFELEVTDAELTDDVYFNLDELQSQLDSEKEETRDELWDARQLQDVKDIDTNPIYSIYNHYTTIKGKKYLITTWNDNTLIIRIEECWDEFPVILNFYEPFKTDPFGICIPDIVEDKQKAKQLFLNLNRIKAEYEAWWDVFTVDTDALLNPRELRQRTLWPKYVKIDARKNSNPINPVARPQIWQDAYNMPNVLDSQVTTDLWLDERALGWAWDFRATATENQRVQRNQNVKLILNAKINSWWDKKFWIYWLKIYDEYFDYKSEKNIKLQNSFGNIIFTVKRKDIDTWRNIDVTVVSKSEQDVINQKNAQALLVIADMVLQDQSTPQISKTFAKRQIAKAQWLDKDKISVLFPESIDEAQAKMDIELINNEVEDAEELLVKNINMTDDHMTYIVVYNKAIDNDIKRKAIEARKTAYILSGQKQQAGQAQQWVSKWVQQAVIQWQQETDAASLQQVTA